VTEPIQLRVPRFEQPDDVTCGPTCLAKVYAYYGLDKPLSAVLRETPRNPDGGTLAVNLGIGALRNGFRPTVYPFGFRILDPTWRRLSARTLRARLKRRRSALRTRRQRRALDAYIAFLEAGGKIAFRDPTRALMVGILKRGHPILTGLSATSLYRTPREFRNRYDDVRGTSVGHFVVITGYAPASDRFAISDPFAKVPFSRTGRYTVKSERLLSAILLGDATYDAVLLVLGRRRGR
jgi:hypothetical protein